MLRAVQLALGADAPACANAERNGDGEISVDEVVFALQMALQGCPRPAFVHGMSFASWWRGQFASPAAEAALDQLALTTVDTVVVVPTRYMDDSSASAVFADPQRSADAAEIAHVLDAARRRGFRTALKPHVDPLDGFWRGRIQPADIDAWFASYTAYIVEMAQLANAAGSDFLVLATELDSLAVAEHRARWQAVIAAVRQHFAGDLAYASNWDDYRRIDLWDLVDIVGIDGYFPLSTAADPSRAELDEAWTGGAAAPGTGWMHQLQGWFAEAFPARDKKLMFTEIGYVAADYALRRPWELEDNCFAVTGSRPYNGELQRRAYEALFDAAGGLDGVVWWHWEPFPIAAAEGQCRFTPQGKPAELWLRQAELPTASR